jgi:hypothetical protein
MKIGFSFWGFLVPLEKSIHSNTPDGPRGDRLDFVNELISRGHQIIRLQKQREETLYTGTSVDDSGFPDVDVVYCEWRWKTWKNSGENPSEPDYQRQVQILDYYHKQGVPIIIHDGDLKITYEDELRWPNAIITDPCKNPKKLHRERLFFPWVKDLTRFDKPCQYSYNYIYVGNNYERDKQFKKYYGDPSAGLRFWGIQTSVYGNWLQRSPERSDPSLIISSCPHIAFVPRISFRDVFPTLNSAIAVTHITKDDYAKYGNITCRFHEAIISNVPSLIPEEYSCAHSMGLDGRLLVRSPADVVEKIKWISLLNPEERESLVLQQEEELRLIADPRPSTRADQVEQIARR